MRSITALVVDDTRLVLVSTVSILAMIGVSTHEAEDGAEAFALLKMHNEIDVVITDWKMPNMDGVALARVIRADQEVRVAHTPIIMVTGESNHAEPLAAGVNFVLNKPFGIEEMKKLLEQLFP